MPYFSGGIPANAATMPTSNPPTIRPAITPYLRMVRNMVLLRCGGWSRHRPRSRAARQSPERVISAYSPDSRTSGHDPELTRPVNRLGAPPRAQLLEQPRHV